MNYLKFLKDGYAKTRENYPDNPPENKFDFLGDYIFNYITYDSEMSELFARKTVDVIKAINNHTTIEYIRENKENYKWYLILCNMSFLYGKLGWGTSIRGAWWNCDGVTFQSCQLYDGDKQICGYFKLTQEEWEKFISAIIEFVEIENEKTEKVKM